MLLVQVIRMIQEVQILSFLVLLAQGFNKRRSGYCPFLCAPCAGSGCRSKHCYCFSAPGAGLRKVGPDIAYPSVLLVHQQRRSGCRHSFSVHYAGHQEGRPRYCTYFAAACAGYQQKRPEFAISSTL